MVGQTFVRTECLLSRAILKNVLGLFIGVICSCAPIFKFFSAPPDGASTEYQISNSEFSDFLCAYHNSLCIRRHSAVNLPVTDAKHLTNSFAVAACLAWYGPQHH